MGQHYIFFESQQRNNTKWFNNNINKFKGGAANLGAIAFNKNNYNPEDGSEALTYIKNFLTMIQNLAANERNNQINFLQKFGSNLQSDDFREKYFDGEKFKYLEFIADLNLAKKDIEELRQNIQTTKNRMENIATSIDLVDGSEYFYTIEQEGKKEKKSGTFSKEEINELYSQHLMPRYRTMVLRALSKCGEKITSTTNGFFAEKVNTIIKSLPSNQTIIKIIETLISEGSQDPEILRGAIINAAMSIASKLPDQIKKITKETIEQQIKGSEKEIEQIMRAGIDNISLKNLDKKKETLEEFLKAVIENKKGGYAELYLNLPQSQKKKMANLTIGRQIFQAAREYNASISRGQDAVQKAKGQFTKKIKQIITHIQNPHQIKDKTSLTNQINDIYQQIINDTTNDIAKLPPIDTKNLLQQSFYIDSISGPTMAEIKNAVEMYLKSKGNVYQVFFPGNVIKLKNDFSFTYHFNDIKIDDSFSPSQQNIISNLQNLVTKQGQHFLQQYNTAASGSTDVMTAYEEYKKTFKQIIKERQKLLDKLDNSKKTEINKIFDSFLVNVSVKEYQFYNNSIGYGAGSLGGGGTVVEAVPNLINMIQLGGFGFGGGAITQAIIDTLLNSFPESIIGTGYVENITNFLLVGAAMMLFDDGFTSGTEFLELVKNELESFSMPSIHLILVDNFYFPQSYILQNIYENLLKVYSDIQSKLKELFDAPQMTTGVRAQLSLHNDINSNILEQMYSKGGDPWENMSNYAEKNVTISYFFMAGMIDILQDLGNILSMK